MLGKLLDLALWVLGLFTGGGKDKAREEGRELGQAETRAAASADALKRTEEARKSKEKTDEEVRRTPFSDRVDRL